MRLAKDEADIGAMIALGKQFHQEGPFYRSMPWDEPRLWAAGRQALSIGNPGLIMAERDGELVGMAVAMLGEQFYSSVKVATVQLFYVRADARGGAAAVKLICALRQWAIGAGAVNLHLHVTSGIHADKTDRFLRRMGFKQTGGNYVLEGVL